MPYQKSAMGEALEETIDEMIQCGQITAEFARSVMDQFEKSTEKMFKEKVTTHLSFRGKLSGYRLSHDIWTLFLRNVDFQQLPELGTIEKVKIIAYESDVGSKTIEKQKETSKKRKHE